MANSKFACPHCGSDNIQRCSIIYQSGTSSHNSVTTVNGNVEAETSGSSSTNLAQEVAPPQKQEENYAGMFICGAIALFCGYDILHTGFSFLELGLAAFFGFSAYTLNDSNEKASAYNEKQFPIDYETWQHSYICYRCGNRFIIH